MLKMHVAGNMHVRMIFDVGLSRLRMRPATKIQLSMKTVSSYTYVCDDDSLMWYHFHFEVPNNLTAVWKLEIGWLAVLCARLEGRPSQLVVVELGLI
ncbi:hypothetical protein BDA96_09G023500 [Sorghum bicolor]|uniref:Uncharacterized protein n=1 Tax=Sorghum bicolor TaxID=4558 RepID=A0A921Q992_SORBI|nr:hypothetical protein BDA96_09G023500 [Sorghum bicolor]